MMRLDIFPVALVFACLGLPLLWNSLTQRLRTAGYPRRTGQILTFLALVPLVTVPLGHLSSSLLFVVSSYAVSVGALDFATRRDARGIVLLGGSLAGAEFVNPEGGILVAAALPFVLRFAELQHNPRRTAGLVVLLLFVPTLTAMAILYVWFARHVMPLQLLDGGDAMEVGPLRAGPSSLLAGLPMAPPVARSLFLRSPSAGLIAALSGIFVAGAILAAVTRSGDTSSPLLATTGPLALLTISTWEKSRNQIDKAVLTLGGTLLLAALAAFLLQHFGGTG